MRAVLISLHCLLFLFVLFPTELLAQPIYSIHRQLLVSTTSESVDWNETIIPNSIEWKKGDSLILIPYSIEHNTLFPEFSGINNLPDTVTLLFDVLPEIFHQPVILSDSSSIRFVIDQSTPQKNTDITLSQLTSSEGLEYDGALTRGFSIGNNQSLVFDSDLNLQLHGEIGDGYRVTAAITDQHLPIQPDGTTRQLQEFDKVSIQVDKENHSILAGDFDAVEDEDYFMRYNRKLTGLQIQTYESESNYQWAVSGTAAVSKGKFNRQTLIPAEGNQGPYTLQGSNGETFILILAGSERVYLDGQLLTRGEDEDYIMDYNQSEITFTRKILINVRHRITVEFEYAQFNFQKSQNILTAQYENNKWKTFINFFNENDSKSVTGDLELSTEDVRNLSLAGDQTNLFYSSGIHKFTDPYNSNVIVYRLLDTIVDQVTYPGILVWTSAPGESLYTVQFTEVAQGQGDYVLKTEPSPNGRVYQWVAPDALTGISKGNFAPKHLLQAPQQKQLLTCGGAYKVNNHGQLSSEIAISRHDRNRYSSLDDSDNAGLAFHMEYTDLIPIGGKWSVLPYISLASTGAHFSPVDPYRNPEFNRDWAISDAHVFSTMDNLPAAGITIGKGKTFYSRYLYEGYYRKDNYSSDRHTGQIGLDTLGWKINMTIRYLQAEDDINKSTFTRPTLLVEKMVPKMGGWILGINYFEDKQETKLITTDSLSASSFLENKIQFYIKNNISENHQFEIRYLEERPRYPIQNQLLLSEVAKEWNATGFWHKWKNIQLDYTVRHREIFPKNNFANTHARNLLGRLDMRSEWLNKALRWSAGYELGSGQEPKNEFKYVKVPKGEGNFIWLDDGDGVEEIQEFELAPFADLGEYIRLQLFNSSFIRTRTLAVQQVLHFDFREITKSVWLGKLSLQSSLQMQRKIRDDESSPYWNPFYSAYPDTAVVAASASWRNIFYWNRSSTVYDIQLIHFRQQQQSLQSSGFEIRETENFNLRSRVNLKSKTDLVFNGKIGNRESRSQYFDTRNYKLNSYGLGPEINFIIKDKFRFTGKYDYSYHQQAGGDVHLAAQTFSGEGVWRTGQTTDVSSLISLVNIRYPGSGNINLDYALLEGLRNGENLLWNLRINTRLTETLILTLLYNGRHTGDTKSIHTGSVQVRANF